MKYFLLIFKHKWFVFLAGLKFGCPIWRLITHDLLKFSRSELSHYQRQFFGKADDPEGWARCWLHHQNRNDHHWEYWIPRKGTAEYPSNDPMPMSRDAVLEMIADWFGASRAYTGIWPKKGVKWVWLDDNFWKIIVCPDTRQMLRDELRGFY